jgi:hypothetical protein
LESLKTDGVSLEGLGSGYTLVCEDPMMSNLKDSEDDSHFFCSKGRKGLGRVLGDLIDKSLVIGGEETRLVEDDSLMVLEVGGDCKLSDRKGGHLGAGCESSKGSYIEGSMEVV